MLRGLIMAGAIAAGIALAPPAPAAPSTTTTPPASVYYPNCKAACADGAASIYAGQPGYRAPLDRDGDGIACEVCH